ncbi:MAG: prepilin-type N-terminal cleavage/methylation domain-containing protein [Nitrospirae bacterium]|nr:prepilin-type N-terminal cleavage/methylation domain-containing protein [Nitrospirota bacterium]
MRGQRGFTLIELLVALGIVAVLVTLLYETFNAVLRSTQQTDEESELDQMARISMSIMANELKSAYWRPQGNPPGSTPFVFLGQDGLSATGSSDTLQFTALSHARVAEGMTDPLVSVLAYELVPVPETEMADLMHTEETNTLSLSENSLERYDLAERVVGLNFRYFDGKEWSDEWSAADRRKLPKAVEIQILMKDYTGRERRFITQTDIPLGRM